MYDSIWGEEDSDSYEIPNESLDENNHDLPQNQTDTRTNINEDVNDYHDAQHRGGLIMKAFLQEYGSQLLSKAVEHFIFLCLHYC